MKQHRAPPNPPRLVGLALALACAVVGAAPGAMADDGGYDRLDHNDERSSPTTHDSTRDTGYIQEPRARYGEYDDRRRDHDHDRARRLLEQGDIRPLSEILARVENDLPGRIIDTEFEREGSVYVYEFKVVDSSGRVREVYVDAASARVLKVEDDD